MVLVTAVSTVRLSLTPMLVVLISTWKISSANTFFCEQEQTSKKNFGGFWPCVGRSCCGWVRAAVAELSPGGGGTTRARWRDHTVPRPLGHQGDEEGVALRLSSRTHIHICSS